MLFPIPRNIDEQLTLCCHEETIEKDDAVPALEHEAGSSAFVHQKLGFVPRMEEWKRLQRIRNVFISLKTSMRARNRGHPHAEKVEKPQKFVETLNFRCFSATAGAGQVSNCSLRVEKCLEEGIHCWLTLQPPFLKPSSSSSPT